MPEQRLQRTREAYADRGFTLKIDREMIPRRPAPRADVALVTAAPIFVDDEADAR